MKVTEHIIRAAVLLLLSFSFLSAQKLQTETINTTNGLSNNKVFHTFQDSYGLLWIGTEYGLNLYDGYNFKIFRNNPDDPESINSNVIWWIVEDSEKNLWIATGEGVSKYIRKENKFKNYDLFGDYFSSVTIYIDSKKNIWTAHETENINKYNKENDSWERPKIILDPNITYGNPSQIMNIIEDKDDRLWVASIRYGLLWYDERDTVFRQAEVIYEDGISRFTNFDNNIVDLFSDSLGILWITSRKGIHKYNPVSKKLKTLKRFTFGEFKYESDFGNITKSPNGNIWIANHTNGLFKFDGISDNFKRVTVAGQIYSSDGISNIVMSDGYWDQSGIYWIGTFTKGLIKYNPNKKIFNHYAHDENNKNSISHSYIYSVLESKAHPGKIYVGTRGGGLNIFDTQTNNFSTIPIDFYKDYYGGSVRSILEEEDGSLWLGTSGDGLLKMNPERQIIKRFIPDSSDVNSISGDWVRVIRKDLSGNLWIGTNTGGLNYFDIKRNLFKNFNKPFIRYSQKIIDLIKKKISTDSDKAKIIEVGDFQKLSSTFEVKNQGDYLVLSGGEGTSFDPLMWDYGWIEDSKKNIIWDSKKYASTYYLGGASKNRIAMEVLSLDAGKYSLKYESDDSHSFGNWNAVPPIDDELWGIRIFKIDDVNELKTIKKLLDESVKDFGINGNNIRAIHISQNNNVWVGTYQNGLHKINLNQKNVKTYLFDNKVNSEGSRFNINDIHENSDGSFWLATNRGLIEFDPVKETYKYFRDQDGLPTNVIQSILPGENNELWLGTLNGLSNMKIGLTGKTTFVNYGIEDGLGGMEFYRLAALKSKTGKYYFGGDHGLNEFDSEKSISTPPKLYLSDFKISNVSFMEIFEDSLIEAYLMDLDELFLNHDQNDLSFEFTALHFSNPRKNNYSHQLVGYEDEWVYDNNRIATYTNLDPGKYTFRFKGSNNEGIWNEKGKSISIIISPPFWQTWWAYLGYGFIFLAAFYGVDRVQKRKLLRKAKERMKIQDAEHRAETAELQAKATEAQSKLIQAENERKTKELEEARELQLSMLPKELPKINNLDIAVFMKTATEVGGDYYDISLKDDGSVNIAIGDATGHGMKAGTLVSMMKSLFTANSVVHEMKDFFTSSNTALKKANMERMMIGFAMININGNKAILMNAGMPPIYLFKSKLNEVEEIDLHGTPLGALLGTNYNHREIVINNNDIFLLMSDGFPELQNKSNTMYGYERVKKTFKSIANKSPEEIIKCLESEVINWKEDNDLNDDVTFVVIKIK
ncbi:MAG: SpoIIE family protein phosphatase [Ignavibacteriae bacterium]|nr:hypothetical protein [Ignavibacteriota bacterium]NOG98419.1 SpoIIE family protein phosphatase [Ignavibacteriota bacterium]